MYYDIKLPRKVSGAELKDALKNTASRLKWRCITLVKNYEVSPGSIKVEPREVELSIYPKEGGILGRIERFLAGPMEVSVIIKSQYSTLTVWPENYLASNDDLEKLTLTLYDVLQEPKKIKSPA